jgi:hypothetical protein
MCCGARAQAMAIPDFVEIVLNHNKPSFILNFESSSNLESIFDSVEGWIHDVVPLVLGFSAL